MSDQAQMIVAVKDILVIRPQVRDMWSIADAGLDARYKIHYADPCLDPATPVDVAAYVAALAAVPADGVVATHDNAALLCALVARSRGLPGPTPEAVFACQYKPASRRRQQVAVPGAVPRFAVLDRAAAFQPPFFVKPAFGTLSGGVHRIDSLRQLDDVRANGHSRRYASIAAAMGLEPSDACGHLMEELLTGDEVTLEGYVRSGRFTTVGLTDSVKYAGTDSFESFEYPSRLPEDRRQQMADTAQRVVSELGFDDGLLNIEFIVPEHGHVKIIEVNARISAQYAPLIKALHGRSTYELLFALACGDDPGWSDEPAAGVAISYCLRVFRDAFVVRVPEPQHGLEVLVEPGRRLSEQGHNDPTSYRLAIFYEVGETRQEALARCRARARSLRFELVPTGAPVGSPAPV
jgi:biotin carboxylase